MSKSKQWLNENKHELPEQYRIIFERQVENKLKELKKPTEQQINTICTAAFDYISQIRDYEQRKPYRLYDDLTDSLIKHYQFKKNGDVLSYGHCPDCDKKTLSTAVERPIYIQCQRSKQCGYTALSTELFPEHLIALDKRYPSTDVAPTATVDVYLSVVKGLAIENLQGQYSQHSYHHPNGNRSTATLRFYIETESYVEYLLDPVKLTQHGETTEIQQQHINTKNKIWINKNQNIEERDVIYLTETIFDALALNQNGVKAIALLTHKKIPTALSDYYRMRITWVLAIDNLQHAKKHIATLQTAGENATAILSNDAQQNISWNTRHQKGQLTAKHLKTYRYYAKLELATRAIDKAQLIYEHTDHKINFFTLEHYHCMYRVTVDKKEYDKAYAELNEKDKNSDEINSGAFFMAAKVVKESNCSLKLLHILVSDVGEKPVYSMHISHENGAPSQLIYLNGGAFSSASEFKKSIMVEAPGAQITATAKSLEHRYYHWFRRKPMTVKTLDYAGYNKATAAYIYNDYAVQNGEIYSVNADDFFELKPTGIKTAVDLKQQLTDHAPKDWFNDFKTAYGDGGMVALTWWVGSLFCEQIRADTRNYPFIEIIGEAGSGKTDLVNFLWKLCGKEGDTFNPNSSTMPGRMRKMSQVSCLPVVFNETDNETSAENQHAKKFNWDEQKDLYDGQIARHTGTKTMDNKTRAPLFRAALCAVQNIPVFASEAILSRFIHLQIDRSHHTSAGKLSSDRLNRLEIKDISGFLLHTVVKEKQLLEKFKNHFPLYVAELQKNEKITMQRIIENHAKMMAIADCLPLIMDISQHDTDTIKHRLTKMAEQRQERLKKDTPRVELFWENFHYLNSRFETPSGKGINQEHSINHHPEPDDYIAVNLREYYQLARDRGLDQIPTIELQKILPTSVEIEFIEASKVIKSRITNKSCRCYLFKTPAKKAKDLEAAAKRGR